MKVEILDNMIILDEQGKLTIINNIKRDTIKELIKKLKDFVAENR